MERGHSVEWRRFYGFSCAAESFIKGTGVFQGGDKAGPAQCFDDVRKQTDKAMLYRGEIGVEMRRQGEGAGPSSRAEHA